MVLLLLIACGAPVEGRLPEGIYGSPDLGLRVDADGAATFERSCWRGELGVVDASDGTLNTAFDWVRTGGDPAETGEAPTPATFDGTVTTSRVKGTLASDGEEQAIVLEWGFEPTYFECP
jgi:hypothetical protein